MHTNQSSQDTLNENVTAISLELYLAYKFGRDLTSLFANSIYCRALKSDIDRSVIEQYDDDHLQHGKDYFHAYACAAREGGSRIALGGR